MRTLNVLAATLAATSLLTAAATASSPRRNGTLLMSISRPTNDVGGTSTPASLYTVDAAGSVRLFARARVQSIEFGSYSPDGTTVAFPRVDPATGKLGLWLLGADGRHQRRIVSDLASLSPFFAWAPDGRHLAVHRMNAEDVVLIDLRGRQQRILVRGIAVRAIDWSPDGHTIYFEGWGRGSSPASCKSG